MEESSGANGSAPVRACTHTHTHNNNPHPVLANYYSTISSSAVSLKSQDPGVSPPPLYPLFSALPCLLLKLISECAHAYRAHISISA